MEYELQIRQIQNTKRIILPLISKQPRSYGHLDAVIDTGSPKTIISVSDAMRLNIPFKNLTSASPIQGFGKGNIPVLSMEKFPFSIRSGKGKSKDLITSVVIVDVPTLRKLGENALNHALSLPTLIGIDFLDASGLKLFVDVKGGIAYLED